MLTSGPRQFGRAMRLPEGDVPAGNGAGLFKVGRVARFVAASAERMKKRMGSEVVDAGGNRPTGARLHLNRGLPRQ